MKIKNLLLHALLAISSTLIISCSETINDIEDSLSTANEQKSSELASSLGDCCTFSGDLSESEVTGLLKMREEEKLARDVYQYFFEMFNQIIFENISNSEETHTNAVLNLIVGYGYGDPATTESGVYSDPLFNELYTSLTEQGSQSLVEALKVGAFIEEYDIKDLQDLLEVTENQDLTLVYSNLLQGSKSHLSVFAKVLGQLGETYVPTVITAEEYDEIISSENQKGNRNGNKIGYGTGNGNGSNSGGGSQYGKNNQANAYQGNQKGNNSASNSGVCDGTGPNS